MKLGSAVRRGVVVVATALAAVAAGTLVGASASGDSVVVVRGTDLPAGNRAQLTLVGCDAVFDRAAESLQPMIGVNQGAGGLGKRSLAFDPAGGNAVGLVGYVESMATTTLATLSVRAEAGTTGVAYAGFQAPADAGTDLMWIGRAVVSAPASASWSSVSVTGLGYVWTKYDMSTHELIADVGSSGVPAFVRAMGGDGYGFYAVGFGCDGNPVNLDGWRIGRPGASMTYDFEGYGSATTIAGPDAPVQAGARVTLTGTVVDDQGAPISGARAVLQERQPDGSWDTVQVDTGARVAATVRVRETSTYRWKVFSTPLVEGSTSRPFTVKVADPADPAEPTEPAEPSDGPSDEPSAPPTDAPSEEPTAPASSEAPVEPVETAAPDPTPPPEPPASEPAQEPTEQASEQTQEQADPATDPAAGASEAAAG